MVQRANRDAAVWTLTRPTAAPGRGARARRCASRSESAKRNSNGNPRRDKPRSASTASRPSFFFTGLRPCEQIALVIGDFDPTRNAGNQRGSRRRIDQDSAPASEAIRGRSIAAVAFPTHLIRCSSLSASSSALVATSAFNSAKHCPRIKRTSKERSQRRGVSPSTAEFRDCRVEVLVDPT